MNGCNDHEVISHDNKELAIAVGLNFSTKSWPHPTSVSNLLRSGLILEPDL